MILNRITDKPFMEWKLVLKEGPGRILTLNKRGSFHSSKADYSHPIIYTYKYYHINPNLSRNIFEKQF